MIRGEVALNYLVALNSEVNSSLTEGNQYFAVGNLTVEVETRYFVEGAAENQGFEMVIRNFEEETHFERIIQYFVEARHYFEEAIHHSVANY